MEVAVVGLMLLNVKSVLASVGKWEKRLFALFLLAAFSTVISDFVNRAGLSGTAKRAGTYTILALLIVGVRWLGGNDPRRILAILAGYCLSYVVMIFIGQPGSLAYQIVPWRLGLGMAATTFVCVLMAGSPRVERIGGFLLLALAVVDMYLEARAIAVISAFTGILVLWTQLKRRNRPYRFAPRVLVALGVGACVAAALSYTVMRLATEHHMLPSALEDKMEHQLSSPYGIIAAGRPESVAAIYGVMRHPLLGVGSTNVDPYVADLQAQMYSSGYIFSSHAQILAETKRWQLLNLDATPSHSHIFGAWIDAGIGAALCWMAVLCLVVYVLSRMLLWHHPFTALISLYSMATIWDVFFSPGPIRIDMAVRLMVILYGFSLLSAFDEKAIAGGALMGGDRKRRLRIRWGHA